MASTQPPATTGPALRLRYAAVSDLGRHRKDNQDSGYASEHLLVIADGVGGAAYGDVASATAVHLLRRLDQDPAVRDAQGEDALGALAGAVHRVHDRLGELVEADHELAGTSTTLTAALFDGHRLAVAHVGDSRAYLLRAGRVQQVTKDHTFVQTLVDDGQITEEESRHHPHRNIIMRAVDGVHETEPDLFYVELEPGDRVMLCSDGCSGVLTDDQIGLLLGDGTVDHAALSLVQSALDGGTTDNVTVVVAETVPADQPETADDAESAMAATGPMLVGAAVNQPRRGGMLARTIFRHRQHDTGEIDPVGDGGVPGTVLDEEELRYAPRPPRRFRTLRRLAYVLVPLLVLAGIGKLGYDWTQRQYFVAEDGPYVAIFRGVQIDLPGLDLSSLEETSAVLVADLTTFNQEQVSDGIVADSLADARRIVENLDPSSADCPTEGNLIPGEECDTVTPSPTPSPTPTPSETPSENPTSSARGSGAGATP